MISKDERKTISCAEAREVLLPQATRPPYPDLRITHVCKLKNLFFFWILQLLALAPLIMGETKVG
jgi:hypothetical protein